MRGSKLGNKYIRDEVINSLSNEREMEQNTALELVQGAGGGGSVLDKALALANKSAQQEQEKQAALDMEQEHTKPVMSDDWPFLSETEKDDITHDLDTIDDYGIGR